MRKATVALLSGLICLVFAYSALAYPTVYPTGTTIYKPSEAYNGWVFLRVDGLQPPTSYIMDMNGNVVHRWKTSGLITERTRLLPNGHLLTIQKLPGWKKFGIVEYDWNDNIVFKYEPPEDAHHDLRKLPNGNYLTVLKWPVPESIIKDLKTLETPKFLWGTIERNKLPLMTGDRAIEVSPEGKIVWDWVFHEYLDANIFSPLCALTDWTHTNSIQSIPENPYYNKGDQRFKPGNILINPRNMNYVYIIDKDTKKVVWEWTHGYAGGYSHSHETEMIEKGLPGEGNIITFDNGLFPRDRDHSGQSMIIEINPATKKLIWKYETVGPSNIKFFSKTSASQQRLPNGNTLINEANTGRIFQVKSQKTTEHQDGGEIVWEYVVQKIPGTQWEKRSANVNPPQTNWSPRVVAYDYCPQLKAIYEKSKPTELAVTPPVNEEWQLKPDAK
jgi:hypothetical protein